MDVEHDLGIGLGLRQSHLTQILESRPDVPWFEVLADNYLSIDGLCTRDLEQLRGDYPLSLHCVGMSIGSTDPLNQAYLDQVKELAHRIEPLWISDHLCWTSVHGIHLHNLLPLPYTEETVAHVAGRICQVQDILGRQLVIENVSSYLSFSQSNMSEWEFMDQVLRRSECRMLLDISNVVVNSLNQRFDALHFLSGLDPKYVMQYHLGGYEERTGYILDTHGAPISDQALELCATAQRIVGERPITIEWDENIPSLEELLLERTRVEERLT